MTDCVTIVHIVVPDQGREQHIFYHPSVNLYRTTVTTLPKFTSNLRGANTADGGNPAPPLSTLVSDASPVNTKQRYCFNHGFMNRGFMNRGALVISIALGLWWCLSGP